MLALGILVSGNLGKSSLEHLFLHSEHNVKFVLTDSNSEKIIDFCKAQNIAVFAGNPNTFKCLNFFNEFSIDVLLSVNYLFIIGADLINLPGGICVNLHGSLLPKYRGRTPHVWAIINGETETGITAHLIDEGCDTGAIIEQIHVPINRNDTGATILSKYTKLYIPLIEKVLLDYTNNQLSFTEQDDATSSYFGKRTPESGLINWNQSVEQIRNWIRAQSDPYPGAFTYVGGEKVIIDWAEPYDIGIDTRTQIPGTIMSVSPVVIVACLDGCIELTSIRINLNKLAPDLIFKNENRNESSS